MSHKIDNLIFSSILFINLSIVAVGFVFLYPFRVIELKSIRMLTPIVKVGTQAKYEASFCKFYDVPGMAQRKLVDHYEYFLVQEISNSIGVGCTTKVFSIPIPSWAEAGVYRIDTQLSHRLFSLRDINFSYSTPNFEVVK